MLTCQHERLKYLDYLQEAELKIVLQQKRWMSMGAHGVWYNEISKYDVKYGRKEHEWCLET